MWLLRAGVGLEGKWEVTASRYGISFECDENVPKLTMVMAVPPCQSTKIH